MKADLNEWFNQDAFRESVSMFMFRQQLTIEELSQRVDIHPLGPKNFVEREGDLSLRLASALAEACDLSLDEFRLSVKEHDKYIDNKHGREW